eukprot:9466394-Pyramimonas_sp.AAC.1
MCPLGEHATRNPPVRRTAREADSSLPRFPPLAKLLWVLHEICSSSLSDASTAGSAAAGSTGCAGCAAVACAARPASPSPRLAEGRAPSPQLAE